MIEKGCVSGIYINYVFPFIWFNKLALRIWYVLSIEIVQIEHRELYILLMCLLVTDSKNTEMCRNKIFTTYCIECTHYSYVLQNINILEDWPYSLPDSIA